MQFNSLEYTVFLGIVLVLYYRVARTFSAQRTLVIAASMFFYASWSVPFLLHFVLIVGLNYLAALWMEQVQQPRTKAVVLWTAIVGNLLNLGIFKYSGFAVGTANWILSYLGYGQAVAASPGIVLPLAISFYTFHAISYLVDQYRESSDSKAGGLLDFMFYIMLFPHQIAGPILRGHELFPQLGYKIWNAACIQDGFHRLVIGLFQKSVIADNLAIVVDHGFGEYQSLSALETYVVLVAYAFQIFFDFSGYTNMGIGSEKLLGYSLPENFDAPYLANNISEFWRRWHMTLSRWVRDYIYIPLGGSRGSELVVARNVVITMVLVGLWHGASWTFVVWGLYHGIGLAVHRVYNQVAFSSVLRAQMPRWAYQGVAVCLTFHFVMMGWILFRAPDFHVAFGVLQKFGGLLDPSGWHVNQAYLLKTYGFTAMILYGIYLLARRSETLTTALREQPRLRLPAYSLAMYLVILLTPVHTDPFIYFQF